MNIRVETDTQFRVSAAGSKAPRPEDAAEPTSAPPPRPVAVFVAHGMGQQLSFSTLEATAKGMEDALLRARRWGPGCAGAHPSGAPLSEADRAACEAHVSVAAKTHRLGDIRTPSVVLTVADKSTPPVHLYEGYWAPLTEGQVTLRDVMRFLVQAAWNGLRKGVGQPIERYMFGHTSLHEVPGMAFLGLLVTTLALASLVLLNAVIAGVVVDAGYDVLAAPPDTAVAAEAPSAPAAEAPGEPAETLTDVFSRALTTLAIGYLAVTLAFGLLLGVAMLWAGRTYTHGRLSAALRAFLTGVWVLFFVWLLATLLVGLGTLAVLLHGVGLVPGEADRAATVLIVSLFSALGAGLYSWLNGRSLLKAYKRHVEAHAGTVPLPDFDGRPLSGGRLLGLTAVLVLAVVAALASAVALLARYTPDLAGLIGATEQTAVRMAVWVTLFLVSLAIRNLLVQYFGDVAAYISPHTLDRFASLRRSIRDVSVRVLRSIYHAVDEDGEAMYGGVVVVGHSLGSVVAYDALNRVLAEDEAAIDEARRARKSAKRRAARENRAPDDDGLQGHRVRARTRLLLTFGSPLDKTAYIFRAQNQSLSKVREALANAVQPLILRTDLRTFPWINVHSPRDVIGSALDLYDLPHEKEDHKDFFATRHKAHATADDPLPLRRDGHDCPLCVIDVDDPGARVPLVAHVEHWKTWAVFDVLVAAAFAADEAEAKAAAFRAAAAAGRG